MINGFAVERQIEVYIPISYGEKSSSNSSGEVTNMNVDLKEFYFGNEIPSISTWLFNNDFSEQSPDFVQRLQNNISQYSSLFISFSIERMVLLDKYFQAKETQSIREQCEQVVELICQKMFNADVHANEVYGYFLSLTL